MESITISEELLEYLIRVVREGLKVTDIPQEAKDDLSQWCDDEEDYLHSLHQWETNGAPCRE